MIERNQLAVALQSQEIQTLSCEDHERAAFFLQRRWACVLVIWGINIFPGSLSKEV
jgi:hypothetical protein